MKVPPVYGGDKEGGPDRVTPLRPAFVFFGENPASPFTPR
jgi:hypothetical protein